MTVTSFWGIIGFTLTLPFFAFLAYTSFQYYCAKNDASQSAIDDHLLKLPLILGFFRDHNFRKFVTVTSQKPNLIMLVRVMWIVIIVSFMLGIPFVVARETQPIGDRILHLMILILDLALFFISWRFGKSVGK